MLTWMAIKFGGAGEWSAGYAVDVNLVNTKRNEAMMLNLVVDGARIASGRGTLIAEDPTTEVSSLNCQEIMQRQTVQLEPGKPINLPAADVLSLAVELA